MMNFELNIQLIFLSFLFISISEVWMQYRQNDYILTLERIEVLSYDKNYFFLMKIQNFKFNRTTFAHNMTFHLKQDFGRDLKILLQAYKFASNEYRLFPIRMMFDVCDSIDRNDCGTQNLYKCGNFCRCPVRKGNYTACNFAPDYSRFPPYLPGGKYRSEMTFIYKSQEIAMIEGYCEIVPKNSWELAPSNAKHN